MPKPVLQIIDYKNDSEVKLIATGDLNAQYSADLKISYMELLATGQDVHLDLQKANSFDASAIQLTYALKQRLINADRKLTVELPANPSLRQLLEKTSINKIL